MARFYERFSSCQRYLGNRYDFPDTLPLEGELVGMQKWYGIAISKLAAILAERP